MQNNSFITIPKELEMINNERTRGMQVRARATHIENNEQNSAYDGTSITDPEKILECQKAFYEKLYKETSVKLDNEQLHAENYFIGANNMPILTDVEKEETDVEITLQEIAIAVKNLPNSKSPGSDGIPIEFYNCFWNKVYNAVFESITYAIKEGHLSMDQKRGILSLIPKKDKDIKMLKNWGLNKTQITLLTYV